MQKKYMLRHVMADILSGVKFTSVFSCVDMAEDLDAKSGSPILKCGYFGMLKAEFDCATGNVIGDYMEKPAYYALQNLCSVLDENVTPVYIPHIITPKKSERIDGFDCSAKDIICGGLLKQNGSKAFVYWNSTDMVTTKEYESTITFEISGVDGDVHLIDPGEGYVYEVPGTVMEKCGETVYKFSNIIIKDYPLIITFGKFYKD